MIRIYRDTFVPKYNSGIWLWDKNSHKFRFSPYISCESDAFQVSSNGLVFKATLNQLEETIFRQEFMRSNSLFDEDVIILDDIKNLVLFLAPSTILTKEFINFFHTECVDKFLKALIMYFEYFLRLVEFILIRRDEVSGKAAQIESKKSMITKFIFSEYLVQYRLLLAREYSVIITGKGEMENFYHMIPVVNISKSIGDKAFHESFMAVCTQVVWIAHHRRSFEIVDDEMNRLFRSHHFKLKRQDAVIFSAKEKMLLYGRSNKNANFRYQNSPVIQELMRIKQKDLPVLWICEKKYRGNDLRIKEIELECVVPDSQLVLIGVTHGILGHPNHLYNTLLQLDWEVLRSKNYSKEYDPYHLVTQPYLEIPDFKAFQRHYKSLEQNFQYKHRPYNLNLQLIKKWKKRDEIIGQIMKTAALTDIISKCRLEIEEIGKDKRKSSIEITADYVELRKKILKEKSE